MKIFKNFIGLAAMALCLGFALAAVTTMHLLTAMRL